MFTIGMTSFGNAFFTLSTMLVSIPTGINTFNWLATMWGGRIRFQTPMLFTIAFLFQWVIAGLDRHYAFGRARGTGNCITHIL